MKSQSKSLEETFCLGIWEEEPQGRIETQRLTAGWPSNSLKEKGSEMGRDRSLGFVSLDFLLTSMCISREGWSQSQRLVEARG